MLDFLKQYLKIINYAMIGLVFGFAFFYILMNAYHSLELKKNFNVVVEEESSIKKLQTKLDKIKVNIQGFDANKYTGPIGSTRAMIISQNLNSCLVELNNKTMKEVRAKNVISIVDVYHLRESYENDVLSSCIVNNLYWLTTMNETTFPDSYLSTNSKITKLYVESLLTDTEYLKKDLLNNSSYFFNTTIATASMKNNTKDGFYEVLAAYNRAASLVEYVSDWFYSETKEAR